MYNKYFTIRNKNTKLSYISMVILTTSTSAQTFSFIPRSLTYDGLYVTDESTNTTSTISITSSASNDYYETITASFTLIEGRFYTFEVRNGSDVVFKGKIFCTDQTVSTYSVNNNNYTQHTTTNDFIMYE